jgi:antitoxin component YwqK of YwqJK toxin-antitoxin module
MQLIDRNGFSETISSKDRLSTFQKIDFLTPQSYQKVLRVFSRDSKGKSQSIISSYHDNGQIWQYLEVIDGRAHGTYREWYSNGTLMIQTTVIEGIADISETAQTSWVFDGISQVWDEEGHLKAIFTYDKGLLHSDALYYYPQGQLFKTIPYQQNMIEGTVYVYDEQGEVLESIEFQKGEKHGKALGYWPDRKQKYEEAYEKGLLLKGQYFSSSGQLISQVKDGNGYQAFFQDRSLEALREVKNGKMEGEVQLFDQEGFIKTLYHEKDEKKHGEEWEYFPKTKQPKLFLSWSEDTIQGQVKTWYENGVLESQREMTANKKHGLSFAWYPTGEVMLMEEYENDHLIKGSYYKKGDKFPVSKVENGKGLATLYDAQGIFFKKITYERGKPLLDSTE